MFTTSSSHTPRELATRTASGISVALLWCAGDDRLTIEVHDRRTGQRLAYEPAPHEALAAFRHPYVYAPAS